MHTRNTILAIGFWSGLAAFTATMAYVIVQLLQVAGVLHFPADEIWIYGTSLCIVLPFLLEILALHYVTPEDKRFWSHAALVCSIIYAVFVTANYVVQLATVIPMKLKGTAAEIRYQRWVRISFMANALVTPLITYVYFYQPFSENLLFLGFPWGITAPLAMLALAIMFRKNSKVAPK